MTRERLASEGGLAVYSGQPLGEEVAARRAQRRPRAGDDPSQPHPDLAIGLHRSRLLGGYPIRSGRSTGNRPALLSS